MTLDPAINYTNLGVKTNTTGWPELDGTGFQNPTGTDASWDLNATAASQLKNTGPIIQVNSEAGTLTLSPQPLS